MPNRGHTHTQKLEIASFSSCGDDDRKGKAWDSSGKELQLKENLLLFLLK